MKLLITQPKLAMQRARGVKEYLIFKSVEAGRDPIAGGYIG